MKKSILTAAAAAILLSTPALAQVSDDINVDLTVTAEPSITIVPPPDISVSSDGVTATPTSASVDVCFETSLSDIRVTIAKQNAINNSFPSLYETTINDFINYKILGLVIGSGTLRPFNTVDSFDFDLSAATLGVSSCSPSQYDFSFSVQVEDDPSPATRAISETVADNNLDDGTPYVFSDVLTVTLEPIL